MPVPAHTIPIPGSPAHAEIDLVRRVCSAPRLWFPRTRGDRPELDKQLTKADAVPPHTRG